MNDTDTARQLRLLALGLAEMQRRMDNISREVRDWEFDGEVKHGGDFFPPAKADATRGQPTKAGRVIYNTDDGQLNVDDGTNWTLPDGTTT